ncbi:MAG TPA: MFS transporter [Pseudogracilibacillus sp.]|nr:MFS transporter [Pseudogracilibacillus sp.]
MLEGKQQATTKLNISFIILIIGVFMAALDNGIISAALTTINSSFGVSASTGTWGITLYTLGLAVMTPIAGKLSDRYGRKKLFLIEIIVFTTGSLSVALSPNYTFFLAARLFQSFGGGGIFVIASSYVISTVSKKRQGSILGLLGGMHGLASVIGPNIGSFLIDITGSWHWLFLINVPIGGALMIGGWLVLEENREKVLSSIDFLGISLLSFSILSMMLAINNVSTREGIQSLFHFKISGFMIISFLIFTIFIVVEKKREEKDKTDPILPYRLLRNPTYTVTMIMALISGTFIGSIIFIPSFVEQVLAIPVEKSGYWMTPLAIASGIGAAGGGFFVDKKGPVQTLIASGVITFIGFGGLGVLAETTSMFIIFSTIAGFGFGFILGAPLTVLTSNAAGSQKGSALGTLSVARQVGITISPTIFGSIIQHGFSNMERIIPNKLSKYGVETDEVSVHQIERLSDSHYSEIQTKIANIPSEDVRFALQEAFNEAARNAYEPIYILVACLTVLIVVLSVIFHHDFSQDEAKENSKSEEKN